MYVFMACTLYHGMYISEWQVIFPALDSRIKNVAPTYTLEHKDENDIFDLLSGLLSSVQKENNLSKSVSRQLISCTEAIQTSLGQHMSKEEEQVDFLTFFLTNNNWGIYDLIALMKNACLYIFSKDERFMQLSEVIRIQESRVLGPEYVFCIISILGLGNCKKGIGWV